MLPAVSRERRVPREVEGHRVFELQATGSSNAEALAGLKEGRLAPGDVLVADEQTAGRGRRGRDWVTVPGRSLAASLILAPPPLPRLSRLTVLGAVAACRSLAALGVADVTIKWPNDLMRGERKVGGLLLELADAGRVAVLGVGINLELRPGDLPPALLETAGDVGLTGGRADRDRLLSGLLAEFDRALHELGSAADRERGEEYRRRSWLSGRRVVLERGGERISGRVEAVTADGDLLLEGSRLLAGESVQLRSVEGTGRGSR
jgi:BirA family biotin operon repressor/biotin-[acetyl-CoA-carboxylase] ligase